MQIFLDVGWIPGIAFLAALGYSFFSRQLDFSRKLILAVTVLHCAFDFDLQFLTMFFVLTLLVRSGRGKKQIAISVHPLPSFVMGAAACVCLYMGVACSLSALHRIEASHRLYPWNTRNEVALLMAAGDTKKEDAIAARIIRQNRYVPVAYSARSRYYYSQGDFKKTIEYKNRVLDLTPFSYAEYREYASILLNGVALYAQSGDTYSAVYCRDELFRLEERLDSCNSRLSKWGKMIVDQPVTSFEEPLSVAIASLKEG